jgi:hypothetical protein
MKWTRDQGAVIPGMMEGASAKWVEGKERRIEGDGNVDIKKLVVSNESAT